MPLESLVYLVLFLAAQGFLASSFIFLVWAFLGRRGEPRTRRLGILLSSLLLFAAAALSSFSMMYLVLMPAVMPILRPEFRLPYGWLTSALSILAPLLIFAAVGLVIRHLWRPRGAWKPVLLTSLCLFLLFVTVSAADYGLIYSVQVPAFDRYVMIESGPYLTRVGEAAPDASFTMLDGRQLRLAELHGKVVLLNFFATWCGPCLAELPHLQEIWNESGGNDDFAMLVVGLEESQELVTAFQTEKGFTFPMAFDPDRSAYERFADELIPRTYLVGRDGRILCQSHGFGEEMDVYKNELVRLRKLISDELAGDQ